MIANGLRRRAALGTTANPYLLREVFTTAAAAPLPSSRVPEPGPGLWQVKDTGAHLSIAGGQLVCDGGTTNWGDPGLVDTIPAPRAGGRVLLATLTTAATGTSDTQVGWHTGLTIDVIRAAAFSFTTFNVIQLFENGVGVSQLAAYVANTTYQVAVALRQGGGAWYFIQGGIWARWTLLGWGVTNTTSMVYPALIGVDKAFTAASVLVPAGLFIPAPVVSDSFVRADGVMGSTDGLAAPEANGGGGIAWGNALGTWGIASNVAACSVLSGGVGYVSAAAPNANVLVEAPVTRTAGTAGVVVRWADANNFVRAIHDGTNVKLIKRVGGTETTVFTSAFAYVAGAPIRIACDGTAFYVWYNKSLRSGTATTITDAGLQTGTGVGLYASDLSAAFGAFQAWGRGPGGEYAGLGAL